MQVAEELVQAGMTSGEKFGSKLTEFCREKQFRTIIETGTYLGTGTTRSIINGLSGDYRFISIENDPEHFKVAKQNLRDCPNIHLINGLSIGRPELPIDITYEFPEFVVIDHKPKNRLQLYLKELAHNVIDNALNIALAYFEYKPEFVLLDSCGLIGFHEFNYLMQRVKAPFYLALDDTDHYKHYQTMEYIRQHPEKFKIIWEVRGKTYPNDADRDKFGSAIVRVS